MQSIPTQQYIEDKLLSETEALFKHIYWVQQEFAIEPSNKEHIKASIKFNDINERKEDFLRELVCTVVDWVYNKEKVQEIINKRLEQTPGSEANAYAFLNQQAFSKFRPNAPQGQFGELLLFNFIQHFFQATPLLRKQRITTSVGHERFGADAIHYKKDENKNVFILGESKCYKSKYQFKTAFETSLSSIAASFENLDKELGLYVHDDFIEAPLIDVAESYKNGNLTDVYFELVCIIAYHENNKPKGDDEESIRKEILKAVEDKCSNIEDDLFNKIAKNILNRIHYIFFPVFEMDKLLDDFSTQIGSKS